VTAADDDGVELVLPRHDPPSVQIALDFTLRSDTGLIGILTRFAQCPPLPQQVPALVELHLDPPEPSVFLGLVDLVVLQLGAEFVLLGDEFVDLRENVRVLRVRSHGPSLPDYRVTRGH
jgi:hypothetical protein